MPGCFKTAAQKKTCTDIIKLNEGMVKAVENKTKAPRHSFSKILLRQEAFLKGFPCISNVCGCNRSNLVKTNNSPLHWNHAIESRGLLEI